MRKTLTQVTIMVRAVIFARHSGSWSKVHRYFGNLIIITEIKERLVFYLIITRKLALDYILTGQQHFFF